MKTAWKTTAVSFAALALSALACNIDLPNLDDDEVVSQFLPDGIELEIDELPEETEGGKTIHADRCTGAPQYDRTLRAGARIIHSFHRFADRSFALAARIHEDITDANETTVSGTFLVNGLPVDYIADFSAFDINDDGTPDGSGLPGVEPVALRVWVDRGGGFQRFMCALVTTRPSTDNAGAGQVFVFPYAANADAYADLQINVEWDRTESSHKWNQAYVSGWTHADVDLSIGHQRVDVRTDGQGQVEKTIRSTNVFNESPSGFGSYAMAAHFMREGTNVLISGESTGGTFNVDFENVCIDIAGCSVDLTGDGCAAFDTQDMSLLGEPTVGTADFPAGFSDTPPTP